MVDVRILLRERFVSSVEIIDYMLKEAHFVVTDGDGSGDHGFLRLSYATAMENLAVDKPHCGDRIKPFVGRNRRRTDNALVLSPA